jgi:hypothetical protein
MIEVISFLESLSRTTKLSKSARILLDVFVFNMREDDNLISMAEDYIDRYLKYCREKLSINYSAKNVREVISELMKNKIIFKISNNNYIIDPRMYCKSGSYIHREEILELIEWRKKYYLAKKEGKRMSQYPPEFKSTENRQIDTSDFDW